MPRFSDMLRSANVQTKPDPDAAGITPFQSGFRGVEDINLNAAKNYWGKDASFNMSGGAAQPSNIQSTLLAQYPQLAGIINQYGTNQPPPVADLRSPAVPVPPAAVTPSPAAPSGKGSGNKTPGGQTMQGAKWNPSSNPGLAALMMSQGVQQR